MQSLSDKQEMIIVDASRLIHQLQFDIPSDKMHKFVSLLFGFSAVVIFILQLHVNGLCARANNEVRVMSISQPSHITGSEVVLTLLPPEDPSKTTEVHGKAECILMADRLYTDALPRFRIEDSTGSNITNEWYIVDFYNDFNFYKCTAKKNNYSFYRIEAIYGSTRAVTKITYPNDKGVKVKAVPTPSLGRYPSGGNTAKITFTYYRSLDNDAKDEVKLASYVDVTLVTGTMRNRIANFLRGK